MVERHEGEMEEGKWRVGRHYEWVRVKESVSLASLIMTYLLGLSVSPIAHTT